jgi:ubiquitin C-terminal hydrolase
MPVVWLPLLSVDTEVTLLDLFQRYLKSEDLCGEESLTCNVCDPENKQKYEAKVQHKFTGSARIVIICLKRWRTTSPGVQIKNMGFASHLLDFPHMYFVSLSLDMSSSFSKGKHSGRIRAFTTCTLYRTTTGQMAKAIAQ